MKYLITILLFLLSTTAKSLVILQYHHVSKQTPKSTSIDPALYRAHLQYLEDNNFDVVDILQLKKWLKQGAALPDRAAVITFDDGYSSVYTTAYPELKKRGWPFTVFVNTKAHDEKNLHFMSWDQLREMTKHRAIIANHTDSHPHLIRQQSYEDNEQWQSRRLAEVDFAEKRLKKELGESHLLFAYPYGEYDQALQADLKRLGYLAFGQQSGPVSKGSSHQALPRFAFGGPYGDLADFATKVNSLPFPESRIKVSNSNGKVFSDPLLPKGEDRPVLRIASPLMAYIEQFACYASGQGKIKSEIRGGALVAYANKPLPPGRSRYNCTAHAGGGRYYWHSQLFIRRLPDGSWVDE